MYRLIFMGSAKMLNFLLFSFLFVLPEFTVFVSGSYNRSTLMQLHPELGKNFIMFPNGKVGYLDPPSPNRLFSTASKIEDDVTFVLYTRDNPNGTEISNYTQLLKNFDTSKKTAFCTHGWMSSGKEDTCMSIKDAYLNTSDINVFIIDWSAIADNAIYFIPMGRTKDVGAYYSHLLNYLVDQLRMDPKNFHLIGHSLGAHVSGFAARKVTNGKVGRVTGLDPALPGFELGIIMDSRLNSNDASFVDVIHTCAGFLGLKTPIGHADFYPNGGGPPQPGCTILNILEACSHGRSWELFAETIRLKKPFLASKCPSSHNLSSKKCKGPSIPMGDPTPRTARGVFYLETTDEEPYIKLS